MPNKRMIVYTTNLPDFLQLSFLCLLLFYALVLDLFGDVKRAPRARDRRRQALTGESLLTLSTIRGVGMPLAECYGQPEQVSVQHVRL